MTYVKNKLYNDVAPEWGNRLWPLLNEQGIVKRMAAASDLGKPAAGAIGQLLLDIYDEPVRADRVKQFIGFLIRQVMESHGYAYVESDVPTPDDPLFTRAGTYHRA